MNDSFGAVNAAVRACPTVDRPQHRAHQAALDAIELLAWTDGLVPARARSAA